MIAVPRKSAALESLLPDDPLLVEDLRLVRQRCTSVTVRFDDGSVADFFDEMVDQGFQPAQFARIWIHTHPGESALPSGQDEETFRRVFGACDWAIMFILSCSGRTYTRLRFRSGPGGSLLLPVEIDYSTEFSGSQQEQWAAEYQANVQVEEFLSYRPTEDLHAAQVEEPDWYRYYDLFPEDRYQHEENFHHDHPHESL